ncbi:3-hydroxyacyl-CoA dehydrogenase NAD-binding domain-containing protein [Amphritea sp. HPY]|uniref:3-hydroxyacyl-CoA dehydrogenase NAD-binding domain-containing protein n=1 Tax=Amphritea sp. HPY TaxID=3421652 RepID=UPI003D7D12A4
MIDYFKYAVDGDGICTLTIDQPDSAANVMDQNFIDSLRSNLDRAFNEAAVKGIILTSAKSSFVAGADLKSLETSLTEPQDAKELFDKCWAFSSLLRRMETSGKPVVAALNGAALGGGFEIALACHHRVAVDSRKMMVGLPEIGVGLLPGAGGTQRYLRKLGVAKALPLLLQGRQLKAAKALELGLLDQLASAEELLSVAKTWLLESATAEQPWDCKGYRIPGGNSPMQPELAQLFMGTAASLQATTYQNMPAPLAITSCLYEGMQLPMDKALQVECKYFVQLNLDPVAGNMVRTAFINKTKADNLIRRPQGIEKCSHSKIGVLGAGLMGAGIAYSAAKAGMEVVLIDRDQAAADKGKDYSTTRLQKDLGRGRTTQEKMDTVLARINATTDYNQLSDVTLIVEAVFEDRGVKAEVFAKAEAAMPENAVLATNTSALPVTGLAETTNRPQNMVGLHFFSPVEHMPLVEVIRGEQTSDQTLAYALDFVAQLFKTPILVNDSRGFFTSRFFGAFLNEGVTMVAEGINPALIENAARHLGYPVGPLSISDEVGLDLAYKGAEQARADLGDEFEAGSSVPIITRLVTEHERHGRKNGKGFYDYAEDGSKRLWPQLADLWPRLPDEQQPSEEELQARMVHSQFADAANCLADNVLTDPADGDVGACFGVGFPLYMGGPFAAMDTRGIAQVVSECDRLAAAYDTKRFAIPQMLRDMVADNKTFYGKNPVIPST